MAQPPPPSLARLAVVAAILHFGFDALLRVWPATTPPWLLTPFMSEGFKEMLELVGRGPVSAITSCVEGAVSAIFALALQGVATRRYVALLGLLGGVWLLTAGLMFWVYLDAPAWLVASSLAAGVPRAAVVALVLDRSMARPAPPGPPGEGP
jgi:hypothetical protein